MCLGGCIVEGGELETRGRGVVCGVLRREGIRGWESIGDICGEECG